MALSKKPRSSSSPRYVVNPECLVSITTLVEQMKKVTETQLKVVEEIWGNGKAGLREQVRIQGEDIRNLTVVVAGFTNERADEIKIRASETVARGIEAGIRKQEADLRLKETELRASEALRRKSDWRKWWLGLLAAIALAVITVGQNLTIQALIEKLITTK